MKAVYALSLLAAAASALTFKADPFWKAYKATYGKTYESDAEEARRYEVFNANMQKAAEYNAAGDDAEYGMTPVSDRFPEELFSKIEVPEVDGNEPATEPTAEEVAALPTTWDSRNKGWIPAVRNQGQCGSCWAFSAAATMSANYAKKHGGSPLILSEQQLVDCSPSDHGCNGGWPLSTFAYAQKGVELDSAYPYRATTGTCKFDASKVKAKVASYGYTSKSVDGIKQAVYNNGEISVAVNANKMQSYHGGIITATGCSTSINHAVNVVGWGASGSTKYWIVRNSWGTGWGESGYCRFVAGSNACGIETYPMYATVA
jgi:C1A family cysteine protease